MNTDTRNTLPRHFGVNFPPVCCRRDMRLTRRAPHPLTSAILPRKSRRLSLQLVRFSGRRWP